MVQDKKTIVVKEIEQWRRSKLLPEHYCDFLLNLYLENTGDKKSSFVFPGVSPSAIAGSSWKSWLLTGCAICFILVIGLNFTSFGISLQIAIAILTLLCCYTFAYRFRTSHPLWANVLTGAGSLFLLLAGVYLLKLNHVAEQNFYAAYIAGASAVWLLTGLIGRFPWLHFSGWAALVGCYSWLLHRQLGVLSWLPLQISWLPLCVLFIWAGWLLHFRAKSIGAVSFLVGCFVWFVPEIYGFVLPVAIPRELLQFSLVGKTAVGFLLLFSLRKKWIEWVA